MHSDFSAMGRSARELIPVPNLPMESIRSRSHTAAHGRVRALVVGGAIFLAALGVGAGLGGKIYDGIRIWLSGGKVALVISSGVIVREPTTFDVRNVVSHATFPVVLPVGLPAGTRVMWIVFAPAQRPNSVTIEYRNERAHFNVGFLLFDSAAVNTDSALLPAGPERPRFLETYHWRVGRETVFVPKMYISLRDVNRIKAEMMKASPTDSLAATETMLARITVLGGRFDLADVAQRYAPASGRSVLLDRGHVRAIPDLVKRGRPMLDPRTVYLSNIPSVHGEPDFANAMLHWPKIVVISGNGIRAIDSVLRYTGVGRRNCCEVLFNRPSRTTYWVWTIPMSASARVREYAVDAKTFAVTSL